MKMGKAPEELHEAYPGPSWLEVGLDDGFASAVSAPLSFKLYRILFSGLMWELDEVVESLERSM